MKFYSAFDNLTQPYIDILGEKHTFCFFKDKHTVFIYCQRKNIPKLIRNILQRFEMFKINNFRNDWFLLKVKKLNLTKLHAKTLCHC